MHLVRVAQEASANNVVLLQADVVDHQSLKVRLEKHACGTRGRRREICRLQPSRSLMRLVAPWMSSSIMQRRWTTRAVIYTVRSPSSVSHSRALHSMMTDVLQPQYGCPGRRVHRSRTLLFPRCLSCGSHTELSVHAVQG